jgi:hypothetical protein
MIALLNLFNNAQAVTIIEIQNDVDYYADSVTGSNGGYFDQTFVYDNSLTAAENFALPIDADELAAAVTGSDLTTYVRTPDANLSSDPNYVNSSYIDLSFGNTVNFFNGEGDDLVLFFAGNSTTFKNGNKEDFLFSFAIGEFKSGLLGVTTDHTSDLYGISSPASYALIDLSNFGFADNASADELRIYLGDTSMPALAGIGTFNATVVPLPLSSVLFGSGLALLSLFRRKKA